MRDTLGGVGGPLSAAFEDLAFTLRLEAGLAAQRQVVAIGSSEPL